MAETSVSYFVFLNWIELFILRLSFLIYTEIQTKNFEKSVNVLQ